MFPTSPHGVPRVLGAHPLPSPSALQAAVSIRRPFEACSVGGLPWIHGIFWCQRWEGEIFAFFHERKFFFDFFGVLGGGGWVCEKLVFTLKIDVCV